MTDEANAETRFVSPDSRMGPENALKPAILSKEQYEVLCARRLSFVTLVWQTPSLAIAAQAFLIAASFNLEVSRLSGILLALCACAVGVASIQLMMRSRLLEVDDSRRLHEYEGRIAERFAILHGPPTYEYSKPNRFNGFSAYKSWIIILGLTLLLAIYAVGDAVTRTSKPLEIKPHYTVINPGAGVTIRLDQTTGDMVGCSRLRCTPIVANGVPVADEQSNTQDGRSQFAGLPPTANSLP